MGVRHRWRRTRQQIQRPHGQVSRSRDTRLNDSSTFRTFPRDTLDKVAIK
jgi:hypothetical protein